MSRSLLVWLGAAIGLSCQSARNPDIPEAIAPTASSVAAAPQEPKMTEGAARPHLPLRVTSSPTTFSTNHRPDGARRHSEQLPLQGNGSAQLRVPSQRTLNGRVVLVAHGAGGRAEWHCDFWDRRIPADWLLLCVQGRPISRGADSFYFPQHHFLLDLIQRSVEALETRLETPLTGRGNLFVGYSQGATMGALILPDIAHRFPFALLLEGGYRQWPMFQAKRYADGGGRGLYFVCGTGACDQYARRAVRTAEQAGLNAAYTWAQGAGHRPDGNVGRLAHQGLLRLASWDTSQQ